MKDRPYTDYEGRPEIILNDGFQIQRPDESTVNILNCNGGIYLTLPRENFHDLLLPTMKGLITDLTQGSEFAEKFQSEWRPYEDGETDTANYGVLVSYPLKKEIVRYAPVFWHRLALMARNSTLFLDPKLKMKWEDVRTIFDNTVVAVAGCSLGNNVVHAIIFNLRPKHIKVADGDVYELSNGNRLRMTYEDLGRNKAVVTAEQIHAIDPFMTVSVFNEGVHQKNINDFIAGNQDLNEPPATIIVEETDNPDMKVLIRRKAREYRKPLVMVSDIGSGAQRDSMRFDLQPNLPLVSGGIPDEEIFAIQEQCRTNPNLDNFFRFAFKLIGYHYRKMPEFRKIVQSITRGGQPPEFGGTPQLGSTAMVAGGFAGEAVSRILLGYKLAPRVFINIHKGTSIVEGKRL